MRIAPKKTTTIVFISLFAIFGFFSIAILIVVHLNAKKRVIFIQSGLNELVQASEISLRSKSEELKKTINDYTYWDEMYSFAQKPDYAWAVENINSINESFGFEAVWVLDQNMNLIYKVIDSSYSFLDKSKLPGLEIEKLKNDKLRRVNVKVNDYVGELFCATIHPSSDPGRTSIPSGYFYAFKFWDDHFLHEVGSLIGVEIKVSADSCIPEERNDTLYTSLPVHDYQNSVIAYLQLKKSQEFIRIFDFQNHTLLMVIFISGILILLHIYYLYSHWIAKPLKIVWQSLAMRNDKQIDELYQYGLEFHEMANHFKAFVQQKDDLEKMKNKAEESDRLKTAFLLNMSHEIRTPLNGIIGFSDLLCKLSQDHPSAETYNKVIKSSGKDLMKIIENVMEIAKIESGQLILSLEPISASSILKEFELENPGLNNPYFGSNRVDFVIQPMEEDVVFTADRTRVKQILTELIHNAFKYTPGGLVELSVKGHPEGLIFKVKDTGIGIKESQLPFVFDNFRQAGIDPEANNRGAGLGLAISKRLAEMMGGRIWVESILGTGSVFSIMFPVKKN